ncbi:hypothetical protein ABZX75_25795 [Streptomyces sp. NPDC003038]|uniref:hypothetical protein n=1 Tax=unclassified Streptomyces TaxID=2593676 RepID=UPI0033A3B701
MANPTLRAAAARAAAKRSERARRPYEPADPVAEPDSVPEPAPARVGRGRGTARVAALVALTLALAATATLGWYHREGERTDAARAAALTAARKAAPVILSYDHRHLDRDFAAARTHLTGDFLDQYTKTTKTVVAPTAATYQGVVKATLADPSAISVVSASPDKAVILLFMNQITTSTQITTPRLDLNRVRMALVRTPQGWKVSAVDAL